jgi:hypothetical protein
MKGPVLKISRTVRTPAAKAAMHRHPFGPAEAGPFPNNFTSLYQNFL